MNDRVYSVFVMNKTEFTVLRLGLEHFYSNVLKTKKHCITPHDIDVCNTALINIKKTQQSLESSKK